jgi:hypothetical protein
MSEIYWITRIGALDTLFNIMWVIPVIVICCGVLIILTMLANGDEINDDSKPIFKKVISCLCVVFSIGVVGDIVLPSRDDTMLIYGLGPMIDYVQNNDKVKQLPDKAVDALNRYLDTVAKEENKKE